MTAKTFIASVATAVGLAGAAALAPSPASAQEWPVPDILAAPAALAAAPFVVADALLGGPSYYYYEAPYYGASDYAYVAPGASGESAWIAHCSAKYRSFDPATGTYLGYDGMRHSCR